MKNSVHWLALVVCWATCTLPCLAHSSGPGAVPVLRSAWMLADSTLPLPRTPAEEQAQLQNHFRAVEAILVANTPKSLAIAASRFETSLGIALRSNEQARLLVALYARR